MSKEGSPVSVGGLGSRSSRASSPGISSKKGSSPTIQGTEGLGLGRSGRDLWEIVRVRMLKSGEMKKRIMRSDLVDYPVGVYARFVPHTGQLKEPPMVRAKTQAENAIKNLTRIKKEIAEKKGKVPEALIVLLDQERLFYVKEASAASFYENAQRGREQVLEREGTEEDMRRMALLDEIADKGHPNPNPKPNDLASILRLTSLTKVSAKT